YYALSGLDTFYAFLPGATRCALAPGYYIPRLWRSNIFCAVRVQQIISLFLWELWWELSWG
ncbi:MAG TPA: hypothetical protein VLB46_06980, partial [Pyrinomonadaceae bacterium]|nr:hypothetical protein [Pyrinomonadaceae bacterium]